MTDQSKGLRFDLYERIHLPDEVAAIDELEEIELTPRIQVVEQGDHAVLRGQLLLNGVYRGQADGGSLQTLEHWIPVEITLPLNRVSRLDDISVEIDNFDVDLLSARTLNVTGVLSLRGILVEPLPDAEEAWREEPITALHEREASEDEFPIEAAANPGQNDWQSVTQQPYFTGFAGQLPNAQRVEETSFEDEDEAEEEDENFEAFEEAEQDEEEADDSAEEAEASVTISASPRDGGWSASQWFQSNQPAANQPTANQPIAQPFQSAAPTQPSQEEQRINTYASEQEDEDEDKVEWQEPFEEEAAQSTDQSIASFAQDSASEADWNAQSESSRIPDNDKQEIRIGVGSKQPEASPEQAPNVGLMTLLQTSRREQAARQAAEQVAAKQAEQEKSRSSGDEIEWKTLFLNKQSDENEFRKIRVCIVQRDETLESIAVRYSLNPREILLYNGLNESSVAEGQLLYIP